MTRSFQFKQFSVDDSECGMPVTTDSVLLGSWAELITRTNGVCQLLDIGTGSGLLALMMAQRYTNRLSTSATEENPLRIDAIEIDPRAIQSAQNNFSRSPWQPLFQIIESEFTAWAKKQNPASYHHIISNPPYFSAGLKSDNKTRANARHQGNLTPLDIVQASEKLLIDEGTLSLILPLDEFERLQTQYKRYHQENKRPPQLQLKRYTAIINKPNSIAKRVLIEYIASSKQRTCIYNTLTLHEPHGEPSAEFKALTNAFYLKF